MPNSKTHELIPRGIMTPFMLQKRSIQIAVLICLTQTVHCKKREFNTKISSTSNFNPDQFFEENSQLNFQIISDFSKINSPKQDAAAAKIEVSSENSGSLVNPKFFSSDGAFVYEHNQKRSALRVKVSPRGRASRAACDFKPLSVQFIPIT